MVRVLGYDIGGANTKAAYIETQKGRLISVRLVTEYFPVWKDVKKLSQVLLNLRNRLNADKLDLVSLTMTAELSDAYKTKSDGVRHILRCAQESFPDVPIRVLGVDGELESIAEAEKTPMRVAAANWAATGWLAAQQFKNCVVVDVGSTSCSIIPVIDNRVCAKGKTDLDKLIFGELVYTGSLRTNVAAIVQSVPVRGARAGVASELFALSADVHLILRNITESQYTCETADGREKNVSESFARLARVVCADTDMLSAREITGMARYIYKKQVLQVAHGLSKVYSYVKEQAKSEVPVVIAGLGKDFIAKKAAEKIDADATLDLGQPVLTDIANAAPAFGVALIAASGFEGARITWTP